MAAAPRASAIGGMSATWSGIRVVLGSLAAPIGAGVFAGGAAPMAAHLTRRDADGFPDVAERAARRRRPMR